MSRNGSGVYSLPAGSTVTNGDTSDATDINTPLQDLETDMNTARPVVAGGTGATSASAARTNLGLGTIATQASDSVDIDGGAIDGAAIGGTTPAAGDFTTLGATGVVSVASDIQHTGDTDNKIALTTDAQSFETGGVSRLDLSDSGVRMGATGARVTDIQTTITDSDTKLPTSGAVVDYVAANLAGVAVISTQDLSSAASADFTGFNASLYDAYLFVLQNVVPATDSANLLFRTSTDGGSTYDSGASDYRSASLGLTSLNAAANQNGNGDDAITLALSVGSDTGEDGVSGELRMPGPHLAQTTRASWDLNLIGPTGVFVTLTGSGIRDSQADVDAVRFLFSSGNIETGTITMYGLKNS